MTSESSVEMMEEHSGDWMCGVCDEVMHEKTPGIICLTCRNYVHLPPHVPNCSGLSRKQSSRRKGTFKCTKCKSKKTKKKCSRKDEETEETQSSSDEEKVDNPLDSADETADTVADDVEETDDALADSTKETVDPPADSTEQTDDEFTDDDDMEEIDETPADCDKDDDNNNKTVPTSTHHVAPQPTEGISTDCANDMNIQVR